MGKRFVVCALLWSLAGPAFGQVDQPGAGGGPASPAAPQTSDQPSSQPADNSIASSLGRFADPAGIRAGLADRGITFSLTYTGEVLGNLSGGERRGSIYEGRLDAQFDADLDKLLGWSGAALHANIYQIHGHGLSRYYLANLFVASGIEALSSTRLYELWIEQKLLDDKLSVRAGQLAADTEFLVSQYAALFVNSTFGWPAITAADLPSGGPAYPLATPGVRVKYAPTESLSVLLGLFNGNPAGPGPGDSQINDRTGLEFRTRDPALLIGEAGWTFNGDKDSAGLPGTIKLGGWYHLGRFDDVRRASVSGGATSFALADPGSSGVASRLRGNGGAYLVYDQLLYLEPGTKDQGLAFFTRVSGSPGDRNLVSFYADAGLTYKGVIPGRPNDTLGLSFAYARISDGVRGFDRDAADIAGAGFVRSSEAMLELTYQAEVVPGFTIQPDLQYIWRPGGNVANPLRPSGTLEKDALVAGIRTTIRY